MIASAIWEDERLFCATALSVSSVCAYFCWGMLQTGEAVTRQGHFTRQDTPVRFWYTVVFIGAFALLFGGAGLGYLLGWRHLRQPPP